MSYTESERRLTNDDFRKLFMTPRHDSKSSASGSSSHHASSSCEFATPAPPDSGGSTIRRHHHDKEKHDKRKKKKQFYSKIKREEDEQMAELARKYRDRAKERRDGGAGAAENKSEDLITAQGAYRAVAPDFRGNVNAAERRKQMIQESKFLGGDMEHTHLVKGLDYALLQKVKSELDTKDEALDEIVETEPAEEETKSKKEAVKQKPNVSEHEGFRTKLAKNIHRALFNNAPPERNELFAVGRMAYVMELEDEYAESDVPHTLIRSKADVPNAQGQATLTTNDIVINKLAQILSYLRSGSKSSKKQKKAGRKGDKPEDTDTHTSGGHSKHQEEDSIYGDIGDYVPSKSKPSGPPTSKFSKEAQGESSGGRAKYFEKPGDDEDRGVVIDMPKISRDEFRGRDREAWGPEDPKLTDQTFGSILKKEEKSQTRAQKLMSKMNAQPEGYAECYPGFDEMHDAIDDSDDDFDQTDFSKMDPGKKKGNVGRWDFDTVEEYSEYMSKKEALPKAAFQFGVKMNDGRKTRTKANKTEKNEKAQLDRQWNQIQQIMSKRKGDGNTEESSAKTPRI